MWLDDDGEDDPILGPVPDPTERQWRHPSEVGAERALAANHGNQTPASEMAIPPAGSVAGTTSGSMLWPIAVVGGSIAVAAFGVLGLYAMGAPTTSGVRASGSAISPISDIASPTAVQARQNGLQTTVESLSSLSSPDGPTDGRGDKGYGELANAAGAGPALRTAPTDVPDRRWAATTTALPSTTRGPASTTTTVALPDIPQADQSPESEMSKLAIYEIPDSSAEPLASFVAFDQLLLSSASAIGDRTVIYLRVGSEFYEAIVAYSDPLSDVAVIRLSEPGVEIDLPTVELDTEPVPIEAAVYVGYCDADMANSDGWTEDRSAPAGTSSSILETEPRKQTDTICGLSAQKSVEANGPTSIGNKLSGLIHTAESWRRSLSNHTLYALIGTHIRQSDGMSGAPLRDQLGRIVGMVVGASGQYVAAIPIERALNVLESLIETGTASSAWIGIDSVPFGDGVAVVSVDDRSPVANKLQVGDLLTHVNGVSLHDHDHLIHLVREAGVGATMQLSYIGPYGVDEIEIVVTASPD